MSLEEQYLYAFIDLLKTQPNLFTDKDTDELVAQIALVQDDLEALANIIIAWCHLHPNMIEILRQKRRFLFPKKGEKELRQRAPGINKGEVPPPNYQLNKETLQAEIKRSSDSSNNIESSN
jgi:hypothetical protein